MCQTLEEDRDMGTWNKELETKDVLFIGDS